MRRTGVSRNRTVGFDGAGAGNSFAGTPQVHPCRLLRDVPVAQIPQKISRRPRLYSVSVFDIGASIFNVVIISEASDDSPRDIQVGCRRPTDPSRGESSLASDRRRIFEIYDWNYDRIGRFLLTPVRRIGE